MIPKYTRVNVTFMKLTFDQFEVTKILKCSNESKVNTAHHINIWM